jgi:hypothetical protein
MSISLVGAELQVGGNELTGDVPSVVITQEEQPIINSSSGENGTLFHNALFNLDYTSSGHTGFSPDTWAYNMTQPFTDWLSTFQYNYNQSELFNSTHFFKDAIGININQTWLDGIYCKLTGCVMTGNLQTPRMLIGNFGMVCAGNTSVSDTTNLVLWYKFEDDLLDSSTSGNTGTGVGTYTYQTGKIGKAFQSESDSATVTMGTSVTLGTTSTLAGWFYLTSGTSNYNPIFRGSGEREIHFGAPTGVIQTSDGNFVSVTTIEQNKWYFLVFVDNGVSIKGYLNGVDMGDSVGVYNSFNGWAIEKTLQGKNNNNFFGKSDEIMIYNNRALSLSEIQTLGACVDIPDTGEKVLVQGSGKFSGNLTASNLCYSNGSGCTATNPFDQVLDTSSDVTFLSVSLTEYLYNQNDGSKVLSMPSRMFLDSSEDNSFSFQERRLYGDWEVHAISGTSGNFKVIGTTTSKGFIDTGNSTINNYYGSMYNFSDAGWSIGIATSGVYYNLTISTEGELNGFKIWQTGATGTKLQALVSGYYSVDGVITGDFAGGEYGLGIVTNDANPEVVGRCYTRTNMNGQIPVAITCMKRLVAGDNITLVIDDESNPTKDVSVHNINIKALRIGN